MIKIKYQAYYPEGVEKSDYLASLLERYRARYQQFTEKQLRRPITSIIANIDSLVNTPSFVGCDDLEYNLRNVDAIKELTEKGGAEGVGPRGASSLLSYIEGREGLLRRLPEDFYPEELAAEYKEAVSTIAKEVIKEVCDSTKECIITASNTIENSREHQVEGGASAHQLGDFTRMVTRSQSNKRRRVHFQEEPELQEYTR